EFYQPALRKKLYRTIEELQIDLDEWLIHYNTERTHQGKRCFGRTPMETLLDGKQIWKEKFIA
ncbi:MAG: IS481 family transposase, partial [Oceanospirillales bacterium LUC14_002_19_P2]